MRYVKETVEESLVDYGNAPRFFVSGLARVASIGNNVMFSFYITKPTKRSQHNVVEVELIVPIEAVSSAIDLTVETLGVHSLDIAARTAMRMLPQ
jgi:hypothetical protein